MSGPIEGRKKTSHPWPYPIRNRQHLPTAIPVFSPVTITRTRAARCACTCESCGWGERGEAETRLTHLEGLAHGEAPALRQAALGQRLARGVRLHTGAELAQSADILMPANVNEHQHFEVSLHFWASKLFLTQVRLPYESNQLAYIVIKLKAYLAGLAVSCRPTWLGWLLAVGLPGWAGCWL